MPTGGVRVSRKPIDTSDGTLMRDAQFAESKYRAVFERLRIPVVPEGVAGLAAVRACRWHQRPRAR